jgi:parallel beta-helix repeat protein
VLNNDVTEVASDGAYSALGIILMDCANSVVSANRVGNVTEPGGSSFGIYVNDCTDALVSDNRISGVANGIVFETATGKYMNNMTMGVTTPYTGGTAAGSTNY